MQILPPLGMASLALTTRFMMTCSSWPASARVQRVAEAEVVEEDLGVSADDGEEIVEVVGDAAGEAADGFHFLRLTELIFEDAALGDVFGDGFEDVGGFVAAGYGAAADADGDGGSVFSLPADFEAIHASGALEFVDQAGVLTRFDED